MSEAVRKFKVAWPVITLPPNFGGKRAIVIATAQIPGDVTGVVYAMCIDIDGQAHNQVPVRIATVRAASLAPTYFMEVDPTDAPLIILPPSGGAAA